MKMSDFTACEPQATQYLPAGHRTSRQAAAHSAASGKKDACVKPTTLPPSTYEQVLLIRGRAKRPFFQEIQG